MPQSSVNTVGYTYNRIGILVGSFIADNLLENITENSFRTDALAHYEN